MGFAADDPNSKGEGEGDDQAGQDAEIEQEAVESGWTPEGQFRGNKAKWVDAKTWVEKGRQLQPIIKKQNEGLRNDLERERQERLRLEGEVKAQRAALAAIEDSQLESAKLDVKAARQDIKAKIAAASRDGNHELVADLTEELIELREPESTRRTDGEGGRKTDNNEGNDRPRVDPNFTEWQKTNAWYGTDLRKSGLADGIGREVAAKGLRGADFFRELDKELAKELRGSRKGAGVDRVEGSRSSGGNTDSSVKGYHDLPPEAKRECDGFSNKLVGPNRKFKKIDDWRASYAAKYFEGESA